MRRSDGVFLTKCVKHGHASHPIDPPQTRLPRPRHGRVEFLEGDAPPQIEALPCAVLGAVLVHDIHVGVPRESRQKIEDRVGPRDVVGQHEMADEQAAAGDAAIVELEVAYLAVHLGDSLHRALRVVWRVGEFVRDGRVHEFEVRHVDVEDAVDQMDDVGGIVTAGVVHERQGESPRHRDEKRLDDRIQHVRGRHEIDVVAALRLQGEHHGGELIERNLVAAPVVRDVVVLAENTGEVAVGEEDGARSAAPHERPLLSEVRVKRRDDGQRAAAAFPAFPGHAVHAAAMRAERAGADHPAQLIGDILKSSSCVAFEIGWLRIHC